MAQARADRRGVSLIETLIAMLVLAVTAAGMVGLYAYASRGVGDTAAIANAMDIATAQAELYAIEGPQALVARATAGGCPTFLFPVAPATPPFCGNVVPTLEPGLAPLAPGGCRGVVDSAAIGGVAANSGKFQLHTTLVQLTGAQNGAYEARVSVCWMDLSGNRAGAQRIRKIETRRLVAPRDRG